MSERSLGCCGVGGRPFALGEGDLPLLKAFRAAILKLKSPGSSEFRSRQRNPDDPQVSDCGRVFF